MIKPNVLITGAASGIGKATAARFANGGWDVIAVDVNAVSDHHFIQGSFADETVLTKAVDYLQLNGGTLDAVVSCAGIYRKTDPQTDSPGQWRQVLDTMLNGAYLVSQKAIPLMKNGGRIIHISSIHDGRAEKFSSSYSVAKAAINQLCRSLAVELAPKNILVNAIAPGFVDTAMSVTDGVNELETDWFRTHYIDGHHLPLKRAGKPEEIAGVAYFLAGPEASYITGQVITVDGGLTITF